MIANAPERVLSTLGTDGRRIPMRPRPAHGRFWKARGIVAWSLIGLFVALPFVEIGGRPALLIDLGAPELVVAGAVFRPSDGAALMLLGLALTSAVFLATALWGRVWCGWGCPQTVYLEWVFRPIERLIEGGVAGQRRLDRQGGLPPRRLAKHAVFALLSFAVANVFLAYFVGVDRLAGWITGSPLAHPAGFLVMASVAALMFADFAWFREQTCILACPYGRLQTMLVDRQSMVVAYDAGRGEPRARGKVRLPTVGDCVDCGACAAACPAGIDIRDGLQMECISCTQCIDACDAIMTKVGKPAGLIRHTSQDQLAGKPRRLLRPRTVIYPALLALAVGLLAWQLRGAPSAEVWALRVDGAPFAALSDGRISSQLRLRIENRAGAARRYTVTLEDAGGVELAAPRAAIEVAAGAAMVVPVIALVPAGTFERGERPVTLRIRDDAGFDRALRHTLLGPVTP